MIQSVYNHCLLKIQKIDIVLIYINFYPIDFSDFLKTYIHLMEQISSDDKRRELNNILNNILNTIHSNDIFIIIYQIAISSSTSDTVSSYFISKIQHYFIQHSLEKKVNSLFLSEHKFDLLNIILPQYIYIFIICYMINIFNSYEEIDSFYERLNSCLAYYRAILKFSDVYFVFIII